MDYEFMRELSEEERSNEVQANNIERGNHKSAAEDSPEVVQKLLANDVNDGFSGRVGR